MRLYVSKRSRCVESKEPDEPYGDWYAQYEFRINSIHLNRQSDYDEEFNLPFDVVEGDEVYVLYMIYSSGDSFGRSEGNAEIIWIFKDKQVAKKAESIYTDAVEDDNGSMIEVEVDGGTKLKLSNPAWGYFENCSTIELDTFTVEE